MRKANWWICSASVVVIVIVDVFDHGERVVGIVCGRGRRRRGKQGQGGVSVGGITSCATTTTTSETSFLHHRLSRGGEFFGGGSGIGNIGNGFWCFCLAGAASTPLLQSVKKIKRHLQLSRNPHLLLQKRSKTKIKKSRQTKWAMMDG